MSGTEILMNFHKQKVIDKDFYEGAWTFDEGFEKFIELCGIKNLRPKTIKNYKENYNRFSKFIQECTKCQYIKELSQYDVDNYVLYLRGFEMKDTSVNAYMRSLRVLIYFWIESQQCVKMKIRIHKADKQPKKTYTDDELYRLLRKPNIKTCDFAHYRNWVMVNFFLATGVRVSTLVHIRIEDVDMVFDRIHLTYTKSRKPQIIPMSAQLKNVLREYIGFRQGKQEDYLFCNEYGLQLTTDAVKHAIARYNKSRCVDRNGLHAFRHTFAKKCVMNGVNVFVLQRLMGHSDISVTKEYIELYEDDLAFNIEKYNPLDTFGQQKFVHPKSEAKQTKKKITMQR